MNEEKKDENIENNQYQERETLQPKYEYYLDKSTKYFEINSWRVRIQ